MSKVTQLTKLGVKEIFDTQDKNIKGKTFVFQIKDIKEFDNKKAIKMRLILSDGVATITALVNLNAFEGVKHLEYKVNSIIGVTGFQMNEVKGKKVIIVESPFTLLGQHDSIGSPKPIEKATQSDFNKIVNLSFKDDEKENSNSNNISQNNSEENKGGSTAKKFASGNAKDQGFVKILYNEDADSEFTPIAALNTMSQDWKIKARVTKKGQPRHWKNFNGEGDLLNIELMDEFGTMIQGTFFNKLVFQFKDQIFEGKVYSFEKGYIKQANSRFSSIKNEF